MQIPFKKINVFIILAGLLLIVLGYLLMSTEDFVDATHFSLSLHISPPLIIIGHVVVVVGVLFRKKDAVDGVHADTVSKS